MRFGIGVGFECEVGWDGSGIRCGTWGRMGMRRVVGWEWEMGWDV